MRRLFRETLNHELRLLFGGTTILFTNDFSQHCIHILIYIYSVYPHAACKRKVPCTKFYVLPSLVKE